MKGTSPQWRELQFVHTAHWALPQPEDRQVRTLVAIVALLGSAGLATAQDTTERSYDRFSDTSRVSSSIHLALRPIESVLGLPPRADTVYVNLGVTYKGQTVKASKVSPFIAFSFRSLVRDTTVKRFDDAKTMDFLINGKTRFSAKRDYYSTIPVPLLGGLLEMARYKLSPEQLRVLAKAQRVELRIGTINEVAGAEALATLAAKVLADVSG